LPSGSPLCRVCFAGKYVHVLVVGSPPWIGMVSRRACYPLDWPEYVRDRVDKGLDGESIFQHRFVTSSRLFLCLTFTKLVA
jgi:hypothetical protein